MNSIQQLIIALLICVFCIHHVIGYRSLRPVFSKRQPLLDTKKFGPEWAKQRGLEPGVGGFWPGNPNAKKFKVTIKCPKSGREFTEMVPEDRYIFFYFEEMGHDLPMVNKERMCRQGCCTTCTVKILEGKIKLESALGISKKFRQDGYALSCCAYPLTDVVCELQDEDELYVKQFGESFKTGSVEWGGFIPEDD